MAEIQAEQSRRAVERSRLACEAALLEFVQQAWHLVEPFPFVGGWHVGALCEHLQAVTEGLIRKLLINVPPRSSKTVIASDMWAAWAWARATRDGWLAGPHLRWIIASYALALPSDSNTRCRRIIESDWYQERWPNVRLASDQNAKLKYDTTAGGYRLAASVGGAITGKGGDVLVLDDPHNVRQAESDEVRKAAVKWMRQSWYNRLNDPKRGARVVIQQRTHDDDVSGNLIRDGGWEQLILPMEFEPATACRTVIGFTDPRAAPGELLCPERFGPAEVAEYQTNLGSYAYAAQYQQRPAPAVGGLFQRGWWRFWRRASEPDLPGFEHRTVVVPDFFDEELLSWDCAFKKTADSDRVAGGHWGRKGASKFLLHLFWERASFTETCAALKAQAAAAPKAHAKLVEAKANGDAVIDSLRATVTGLIPVEPEGGKEARASATSPQVEAGNIFIPLHAKWRDAYIDEHASFPKGANDDAVDQQSQALTRWIRKPIPYDGQPKNLPQRRV